MLKRIAFLVLLGTSSAHADHGSQIALTGLYLKPMSNNHTYAYYVSGTQPHSQSWHAEALLPAYTPTFELAYLHEIYRRELNLTIDWLHLNSKTTASKKGNDTLQLSDIAFVGPPFEMSPPVFSIRGVSAEIQYNFDSVTLNLEKILDVSKSWYKAKIIGGLNALYLKQDMVTTFGNSVGSLPTDFSYALPPDPSYSLHIQSVSQYTGLGPILGFIGELILFENFSFVGAASGSLTAGTLSVQENFSGTSNELTLLGLGTSKQQITTPNKTQVVPGFDGKFGLQYLIKLKQISHFSLEAGYRFISYLNIISTTAPQTLVQPGRNPTIPEFATGTMAIVSATQVDRPFNLNGPYLTLKISVF